MKTFKSEDKFYIAGKGTVFTLRIEEATPVKDILNQIVEIDGVKYKCVWLERLACMSHHKEDLWVGQPVGLLVREIVE